MGEGISAKNKLGKKELESIQLLLDTVWGLRGAEITQLMGYEIITYRIDTAKARYILKKYPDQRDIEVRLHLENKVLLFLESQDGLSCPVLQKTNKGENYLKQQGSIWRLQSYLTGTFLAEMDAVNTKMLRSIGTTLARLDGVLDTIVGPFPGFSKEWDLQHSIMSEKHLQYIPDAQNRRVAAYFLHQFKTQVLPRQYELPQQLIYADANEWNLLVNNEKVTGIIDFGDMCKSWRVADLAIGLSYALMFSDHPLEAAIPFISGYTDILPLSHLEVDLLYYLVAARLCTSVCWSAKNTFDEPENEYFTISEERAWRLLHKWIKINPLKAQQTFREAAGLPGLHFPKIDEVLQARYRYISRSLSVSYEQPIHMTRSALQYMYDSQGKTYLDAYNNIMLVGHSHPKIAQASNQALSRLNTNTRYLYDELSTYAATLLSHFPERLSRIFFVNSGSAATDLALRMAFHHTGRKSCVVLREGYHGNTMAAIGVSHYKYKKSRKPDHNIEVEMPNSFSINDPEIKDPGVYFADRACNRIRENEGQIAAFIAEPIVGCGGQVPLPPGYLKQIYPEIRQQGGVCISDEVQVGFGRLGRVFWGFELQEVVPDIVILGKPMGNGHPIGAVVTTKEIAHSFESGPEFFSSFGGNPVSCAIGMAVLEVIREESLQEHALSVGNYFKAELQNVQRDFDAVADIRGEGLFLGVELVDPNGKPNGLLANRITNDMKEKGILISTDGPHNQVIKIKPPLCFTKENVDTFIRVFRKSLNPGVIN